MKRGHDLDINIRFYTEAGSRISIDGLSRVGIEKT